MSRLARLVAFAVGALMALLGLWALVAPQSFYDTLATYPPYNKHLFHDIGAFQLGIGSTLLIGSVIGDALLVALIGGAVGSVLHAASHVVDRDLGGKPSDPWLLGLLALVVVAGAVLRARELKR
jgi:hypothetical protein